METMLFGAPVVVADDDFVRQSFVSRPFVSQQPGDERLTNANRVGGLSGDLLTAVLPALVARVIDQPIATIEPLESYGRVIVARVVPQAAVDPVLPFVTGGASPSYEYWYRRYWQRLTHTLNGWSSRRRLEQAQRRLIGQLPALGLDAAEALYFCVWLQHGSLGDYRLVNNAPQPH